MDNEITKDTAKERKKEEKYLIHHVLTLINNPIFPSQVPLDLSLTFFL